MIHRHGNPPHNPEGLARAKRIGTRQDRSRWELVRVVDGVVVAYHETRQALEKLLRAGLEIRERS